MEYFLSHQILDENVAKTNSFKCNFNEEIFRDLRDWFFEPLNMNLSLCLAAKNGPSVKLKLTLLDLSNGYCSNKELLLIHFVNWLPLKTTSI